ALALFQNLTNQTKVFREAGGRKLFHELRRAAQLDLKDDGQIAICAEPFKVQTRDAPQLLTRVCQVGDLRARVCQRVGYTAVEDRMENLFFALEVEIDRAVGHARDARHIRDLRIEVAVASEDLNGGAQNGLALVGHSRTRRG